MSQTKRLSELKPGDHIHWEGEICKIVRIEPERDDDDEPAVSPRFFDVWLNTNEWPECLSDDEWSVPSDAEVSAHYIAIAERRRVWVETRPAFEAKCMAAARRVAIAVGKDPEEAERQMRAKLDGEQRAFEEEYGE